MNIIEFMHAMGPLRAKVEADLGTMYNLEDVSRGLGLVRRNNEDREYVRKDRVVAMLWAQYIDCVSNLGTLTAPTTTDDFNTFWIRENDFWRFCMRSGTQRAGEFVDWICAEVLPTLAKHRVYIMDEATAKDINDSLKFHPNYVGNVFAHCSIEEFPTLYAQFKEYYAHRKWSKRLELLNTLVAELGRRTEPGWKRILNETVKPDRTIARAKVARYTQMWESRRHNAQQAELTERDGVITENTQTIATLNGTIIDLRNEIAELKKAKDVAIITNGDIWPTHRGRIDAHGMSVNYQYGPKIIGLPPELVRVYQPALDYFYAQMAQHPDDFHRMFGLERSPTYNTWINRFNGMPLVPRSHWEGLDGRHPTAVFLEFIAKSGHDIDNLIKSFLDNIVRRYGFTDDNFIHEIHARRIGTCQTHAQGRIFYSFKPL